MHDPLAVAVAIDPSLVQCTRLPLQVETQGQQTVGMTQRADTRWRIGPGGLRQVNVACSDQIRNIAVDSRDHVWVGCTFQNAVVEFDDQDTEVARIQVNRPSGVGIQQGVGTPTASVDLTVASIAQADGAVVSIDAVGPDDTDGDGVGEVNVSDNNTVTVVEMVTNNGPFGPAEFDVTFNATPPSGCNFVGDPPSAGWS